MLYRQYVEVRLNVILDALKIAPPEFTCWEAMNLTETWNGLTAFWPLYGFLGLFSKLNL